MSNISMTTVTCRHCGDSDIPVGSRFCGGCGNPMPMPTGALTVPTACKCGSEEFDAHGICQDCGRQRKDVRAQEAGISVGPGLAGASDVGKRHHRNDDAFALEGPAGGGPGSVIIVSDGVSKSQMPDIASAAATKVALETISQAMAAGLDPREATRNAIRRAHDAACSVPFDRMAELDPPCATIVTAIVLQGTPGHVEVITGWLGDSRLYWLPKAGPGRLLTRDHSWCNQVVDEGRMTEADAKKDRLAHAITKCLGTSEFDHASPCPEPSVETFVLPADGWLLACTDGLWNYAETPGSLIIAANGRLWTADAAGVCDQFIQFALAHGGMDNISCVLTRLG